MPDSEIAGLTEDTTPDSTDNVYAQDAAGAVDKRVPLSALPISTATQAALDAKQNLDADLTALAAAGNSTVLANTTASFLTADETKLDYLTVTQAVDLDTIETRVNQLDAAVVLMGSWDASAGTFPGGGTAQAGASYIVSVAGTVNAIAFSVGDRVVAILDNASTTVYASNWLKLDYTDQVLSVNTRTGAVTGLAEDSAVVHNTGAENVAGVKTFSSDPLIPDEAYDATAWNGVLEPPTKKAMRDKIESFPDLEATAPIGLDVVTDPTKARFFLEDDLPVRLANIAPSAGVSSTTTATTLLTATHVIPANTVGVGDLIEISVGGMILNDAGADRTVTLRVRIGATNLYTSAAVTFPDLGIVGYPWQITVTFRVHTGGDLYGNAVFLAGTGTNAVHSQKIGSVFLAGVNLAANWDAFDVTAAHSGAESSILTVARWFTITRTPA